MAKKAFTLIELIMVIAIAGIVAGMAIPFISAAANAWFFTKTERDVIFSSRLAMNRMVREIRQINGTAAINTFTGTEFEFVDIDDNTVNFKQSGHALLRNADGLADKLHDPGGLSFTYLDLNGNVTAVSTAIRMVRIRLSLASGDSNVTIQSLARIRRE